MARWSLKAAVTALLGNERIAITQSGVDGYVTPDVLNEFMDPSLIPFSDSGFASDNVQDAIVEAAAGGSGDVVGPASSTDNTVPRFDGTTGKLLQGSGVTVGDNDEISGYRANINAQTGTTYTLVTADRGKVVECTNASAITVTLPNSLAVGFCCTIVQGGAGQVTLSAASGATLRNRQSHTKTAGQWSGATLYVRTNSGGSAAEYVLNGDTSA